MRARPTVTEWADRMRFAAELIEQGCNRTELAAEMAARFHISTRQGRRYAKAATAGKTPSLIPQEKPKPKAVNTGCCYAIQHTKTGLVKIGCTQQWEQRKGSLKVGTECTLITLWQSCDYRFKEAELHDKLKEYRLPASEWFFCAPEDVY